MKPFKQVIKDRRTVEQFNKDLENKHGARVYLGLHNNNSELHLYDLVVPKEKRKQGIGSAIMKEINDFADATNRRVTLNPATKDDYNGTTSKVRLVKFYKRHGYVQNKGRNKDYRTNAGMYRNPKKNEDV